MYSKQTVPVVEDEPTTRRPLKNLTSLLGYQVEPHNNGDEPWEALAMIDPRILISDYKIPDKDELELCRRIRGLRSDTYTCFIFVTAQLLSPSNLEQAINAGVDVASDHGGTKTGAEIKLFTSQSNQAPRWSSRFSARRAGLRGRGLRPVPRAHSPEGFGDARPDDSREP